MFLEVLQYSEMYRFINEHCMAAASLRDEVLDGRPRSFEETKLFRKRLLESLGDAICPVAVPYSYFLDIYHESNLARVCNMPRADVFQAGEVRSFVAQKQGNAMWFENESPPAIVDGSRYLVGKMRKLLDRHKIETPEDLIDAVSRELDRPSRFRMVAVDLRKIDSKKWGTSYPECVKKYRADYKSVTKHPVSLQLFADRLTITKNLTDDDCNKIRAHLLGYCRFKEAEQIVLEDNTALLSKQRKKVSFDSICDALYSPPFNVEINPYSLRKNVRAAEKLISNAENGVFPGDYVSGSRSGWKVPRL